MAPAPERTPGSSEVEPSDEMRRLHDRELISEWRDTENTVLDGMRSASGIVDTTYIDDFKNGSDARLDGFLQSRGMTSADAGYDEVRKLYSDASILNVHDSQWWTSPADRGEDASNMKSMRDVFGELIGAWHDGHAKATDEDEYTLTEEKVALVRAELDEEQIEVFEKYAKLVAERSKSLIKNSETAADIDRLKADATDLIAGIATMLMDELEAAGKSEQEIADTIDLFVNERANYVIAQMENHRIDEYEKTGTLNRLVLDKWAKWTEQSTDKETGKAKFFSEGRMKKLVATAVPTIAAGAAVGALLPFAAVGAVGVGAIAGGVLVFKSVGRNLASGYLDRKSSEKKLAASQSEEMRAQYKASMEQSEIADRQTVFEVLDERSETYRRRNLNRTIGGAALAGGLAFASGTVAAWATDRIDLSGAVDWVQDRWQDTFDTTPPAVNVPLQTHDGVDQHWKLPEVDPLPMPPIPETHTPTIGELLENLSSEAQSISSGEGLFKTFADHGIPKEHWGELINKVGPELDDAYPKLVYFDKAHAEWRLDYNGGEMPRGASEIIIETARDNGWLGEVAPVPVEVETLITPETIADKPFVVESGHGYTHELIEAAKANNVEMTPQQAWANHEAIVKEYGPDYIDLNLKGQAMTDVYSMGSSPADVGLSAPAEAATWSADAQPMIADATDDGIINGSFHNAPQVVEPAQTVEVTPVVDTPPTNIGDTTDQIIQRSNLDGLRAVEPQADQAMWMDMSGDIDKTMQYLRSGQLDALNADLDLQNTLNAISYDLDGITYANSEVPIMRFDTTSYRWMMNSMPEGAEVPQKAIEVIKDYQRSLYALAA